MANWEEYQLNGPRKELQIMAKKDNNITQQNISIVKVIGELLLYILIIIVAVWLMITFVGQRTEVSGPSMYATLEDGDHLWIDKLSYRFSKPKRFDIVVFPYHDNSVYYIKRIIGLPGEKVRIGEDGTIYINGSPLEEDYGYETIASNMIGRANKDIFLKEDEYFVLGDNRNDSKDSRFKEVGNIHKDELEGKAVFRLWPLSKFGRVK